MLKRDINIRCTWCGKVNNLGQWNDLTYSKCTNREMKRAFTPLMEKRAFLKKSDTYYMCPSCNKWSRGCQLVVLDENNKPDKSLGGQAVIHVNKSDNFNNETSCEKEVNPDVKGKENLESKLVNELLDDC